MADTFNLSLEYNISGNDSVVLFTTDYKYGSGNADHIEITEATIKISGSRSNKNSFTNCLSRTNNKIYNALLRSVIYVYMTTGVPFNLGSLSLTFREKSEALPIDDFMNYYRKALPTELIVSPEICKHIFDNTGNGKNLLIALSCFIMAENNAYFVLDDYWKSFNSLYNIYFNTKQEVDKLNKVADDILSGQILQSTSNSIHVMQALSSEIFQTINLRLYMTATKKAKTNSTPQKYRLDVAIRTFNDTDLLKVFCAILDSDKKDTASKNKKLKALGKPIREEQYKCISSTDRADYQQILLTSSTDYFKQLAFFVTQYAYKLRCKYFHGTANSPIVLSKNNNETKEIQLFIKLLEAFIIDFIHSTPFKALYGE